MFRGVKLYMNTMLKPILLKEERGKSSNFCELRGIEDGLLANREILRSKVVRLGCDNWAAGKIVNLRSKREESHKVAIRFVELCR